MKACEQLADRYPRFHSRQRHTCTGMNAHAEREMAVRRSPNVEALRIRKLFRIAVRRPNAQMRVTAGRNCHAAQLGVLRCSTIPKLVGAFHPQALLDRRLDESWIVRELGFDIRISQQEVDAVADQVGRRFMACIEKKYAVVDQLRFRQSFGVVCATVSGKCARVNKNG